VPRKPEEKTGDATWRRGRKSEKRELTGGPWEIFGRERKRVALKGKRRSREKK